MTDWQPIETCPEGVWVRTMRDGENGENVCAWRGERPGDGVESAEWIERDGGRTTVTHHSFAAPTHWQHLSPSKS
jgi:hypothetical protein